MAISKIKAEFMVNIQKVFGVETLSRISMKTSLIFLVVMDGRW